MTFPLLVPRSPSFCHKRLTSFWKRMAEARICPDFKVCLPLLDTTTFALKIFVKVDANYVKLHLLGTPCLLSTATKLLDSSRFSTFVRVT